MTEPKKFALIERYIVPQVIKHATEMLNDSYHFLTPSQKRFFRPGEVLHGWGPNVLGYGENQVATAPLWPYYYNGNAFFMCVKFSLEPVSAKIYNMGNKSYVDKILVLGGSIRGVLGGIEFACPYFLLESARDNNSPTISNRLQKLGFDVPFVKKTKIKLNKGGISAIITEDLTEGRKYEVEDACPYIKRTGDRKLDARLGEMAARIIGKDRQLKPTGHGKEDSPLELAVRHIFFVRGRGTKKELIAGDFDHISAE